MGLFDTMRWKCPKCGFEEDDQTKIGCSLMRDVGPKNCPTDLVNFFTDGTFDCYSCGAEYEFVIVGTSPRGLRCEARILNGDDASRYGSDPGFSESDM